MLGRYSSEIRTGCANERPSGSVRGAPGNWCPYRDLRTPARQFDNDLSGTLRLTNFVPPDPGFGRAIPHLRQFLLDLQQAACARI